MNKQHRVVIYMAKEEYIKLRAKLLLKGKTVSSWFREQARKLINGNHE